MPIEKGCTHCGSDQHNTTDCPMMAAAKDQLDPLGLAPLAQQLNESPAEALRPTVPVPEGWQLVPTNPAKYLDMGWAYIDAAREAEPKRNWAFSHAGYRAMLAASPAPEVQQPMVSVTELVEALTVAETYVQTAFSRAQAKQPQGRKLPPDHQISIDLAQVHAALLSARQGEGERT